MVLWCITYSHIIIIYIYIYILNQHLVKSKRKKTKGRQAIFTARLRQKKKVKRKCGLFCPNIFAHFSLPFSIQFGEVVCGGRGEKTCGPYQNLSCFPPLTKQPKTSFSLQFYHPHFPSSLKLLQPNIALNLFTCVTFKINKFILFILFILLLYTIDVVKSIINLI